METEGFWLESKRHVVRHNPDALLRANGHNPFRSKDKLILWMKVLGNHVSIFKLRGCAPDLARHWWVKAQNFWTWKATGLTNPGLGYQFASRRSRPCLR